MKKLLVVLLLSSTLFAAYTQIDGVWYREMYAPHKSAAEHFDDGQRLLKEKKYDEAARDFLIVIQHYPDTIFFTDALFQTAACYMELGHFDIADEYLAVYLNQKGTLKYFEKAFEYKFIIAERFRGGMRRHPYGIAAIPRIASGKSYAIELYDEISATLPSKEIAVKALYSKGLLLWKMKERKESIEVFQTITRRFPKHQLAADSFVRISELFLDNVKLDAQNPDFLSHGQINLQNFEKAFPSEERLAAVEKNLQAMRELYASALFETGRFYERKHKARAAAIYYRDTIVRYPTTLAAAESKLKLEKIQNQ